MTSFSYKYPDYEGGFLVKSIEAGRITVKNDKGVLIEDYSISHFSKGRVCDLGEVIDVGDTISILRKGTKTFRIDNEKLSKALQGKELEEFNEKHKRDEKGRFAENEDEERSPITGRIIPSDVNKLEYLYKEFCEKVVGTYETPIGEVKISPNDYAKIMGMKINRDKFYDLQKTGNFQWERIEHNTNRYECLKHLKEVLTKPDGIKYENVNKFGSDTVFYKEKDNNYYYAAFTKLGGLRSFHDYRREYIDKIEKKIKKGFKTNKSPLFAIARQGTGFRHSILNDFGVIVKGKNLNKGLAAVKLNTGFGGNGWNKKGGVKPGHKWLERKENPNGEGYIYLYKRSDGKTEWRDGEGKAISKAKEGENKKYTMPELKKGEYIKQGNSIGQVLDVADNIIAVKFEGRDKNTIIKKNEHVEKVNRDRYLLTGDHIKYKDRDAEILQIADNVALIKTEDREYKIIAIEKEIKKQSVGEKEISDISARGVSKYNYVMQGYGELENEDHYEDDYHNHNEYEAFDATSREKGFGYDDDMERRKYISVGDEIKTVTMRYRPKMKDYVVSVDGMENRPLNYEGKRYTISDITDEGYELSFNGEKRFVTHQELQVFNNAFEERSTPKIFRMKPQYTEEELANFTGTGSRRSKLRLRMNMPNQSAEDKAKINAEYEQKQKERTDSLKNDSYITGKDNLEKIGYEVQDNPFNMKKKIEVEGNKFQLTKNYDYKTETWNDNISGPFKDIEVNGSSYKINDINGTGENTVINYGDDKEISLKELKKQNGIGVFKKLGGKALLGSKTKIRLANGETRNAQFAIVELDDIIASHNEKSFEKTPGFPIDEKGNSVNDRDYENDKNAQRLVQKYAQNYDSRNISDSEKADGSVTLSKDFVVLSGNNRTMSGKLASTDFNEKWDDYLKELTEKAEKFGFDKTEIEGYKKPFFVRIDNDFNGSYSKEEFAKYNIDEGKGKTEIQKAATYGDILRNNKGARDSLNELFENAEKLSNVYDSPSKVGNIASTLMNAGIVQEKDLPNYFIEEEGKINGITESGKGMVKQIMLGMVLDEKSMNAARKDGVKEFSDNLIGAVSSISKNNSLEKDYRLTDYINEAVKLEGEYVGKKDKFDSFEDYTTQNSMFGEQPSREAIVLNLLAKKGKNHFNSVIKRYNQHAQAEQEGGMFGSKSREEIFEDLVVNGENSYKPGEDLFTHKEKKIIGRFSKSIDTDQIDLFEEIKAGLLPRRSLEITKSLSKFYHRI